MNDRELLIKFSNYWGTVNEPADYTKKCSITRTILPVKKYLRNRYSENAPDEDTILADFQSIFMNNIENVISLSDFYWMDTVLQLIKEPDIIFRTLTKFKDDKKFLTAEKHYVYVSDQRENIKTCCHDIYHNIFNAKIREDIFNITPKEQEQFKNKMKLVLKELYDAIKNRLVKLYVKAIVGYVKILNDLGVLEEQLEKNNSYREKMNLDILTFPVKQKTGEFKFGINNLMDEKFVSQIPFEKLVFLHAFYSNRVKKVAEDMGAGFFILSKLGELNTDNIRNIDFSTSWTYYKEFLTLRKIISDGIEKIQEDVTQHGIDSFKQSGDYDFINDRQFTISISKIYSDYLKQYEDVYSIYSEPNASFRDDAHLVSSLTTQEYHSKDLSMETSLLIAIQDLSTDNWGYMPENEGGKNSIERKAPNVLLGFDIEGFNMPVRLHFPYKKLVEFFKNRGTSYEIPNYIGAEDMNIDDKNIGASILMPLSSVHRKRLITSIKNMNPNNHYYKFAKHIECMQYKNNLARLLKWKDPLGRRNARTFTNLQTGKEVTYGRENH